MPDVIDTGVLDQLRESITEVRLAAIRALGNVGPDAKAALPELQRATRESQADIRDAATAALKKIQPEP